MIVFGNLSQVQENYPKEYIIMTFDQRTIFPAAWYISIPFLARQQQFRPPDPSMILCTLVEPYF